MMWFKHPVAREGVVTVHEQDHPVDDEGRFCTSDPDCMATCKALFEQIAAPAVEETVTASTEPVTKAPKTPKEPKAPKDPGKGAPGQSDSTGGDLDLKPIVDVGGAAQGAGNPPEGAGEGAGDGAGAKDPAGPAEGDQDTKTGAPE